MKFYTFTAEDMPLIRDAFFEYLVALTMLSAAENNVGSEYPAKCLTRESLTVRKWYDRFANIEYSFENKKQVCLYVADRDGETIEDLNEAKFRLSEDIKHLKNTVKKLERISDFQLSENNRLKKQLAVAEQGAGGV